MCMYTRLSACVCMYTRSEITHGKPEYTYIYMCVCVCVCARGWVRVFVKKLTHHNLEFMSRSLHWYVLMCVYVNRNKDACKSSIYLPKRAVFFQKIHIYPQKIRTCKMEGNLSSASKQNSRLCIYIYYFVRIYTTNTHKKKVPFVHLTKLAIKTN